MTNDRTRQKALAIKYAQMRTPVDLPLIVAMLTSQSKEEREQAKALVRDMVKIADFMQKGSTP